MKRLIIIGGLVYMVGGAALTLLFLKPPQPIIEIRGEPLIHVADFGNEILDFNITNTLLTAWILTGLLTVISLVAVRKRSMVPSGFYNVFESIIELIYNFVTGIAGEKNGRRFFPLVCTLLIYIAFANVMSLTPIFNTFGIFVPLHAEEAEFHEHALVFKDSGGISLITPGAEFVELHADECAAGEAGDECREHAIEEATAEKVSGSNEKLGVLFPYLRGINTDLMTPLSFALISVLIIQWWGISTLGFFKYAGKFVNFSSPINFFVGFLETIAEFAKIISFSFRLFGNMLAGEILLLVMTFLVALSSPIMVIFYGLEVFVGLIQAFVFATLTLVFAMGAVTSHDEHEPSEEAAQH
ncbi:MAG TPA: F0F1 ATP synthase subunit A [Dehalococcoidia bacterium]|nr:F0F1 ATP synthase subunit A [Dehalococcoidia bacterium]